MSPQKYAATILLVSITAILCSRCKKSTSQLLPNPTPTITKVIDSGFAAHFYFKQGSYWIYRDSLSGRMDSFYVSAADTFYESGLPYISITIKQKNTDNLRPADSSSWFYRLKEDNTFLDYRKDSNMAMEFTYFFDVYAPTFIVYTGQGFLSNNDTISIWGHTNDVVVASTLYDSVTEWRHHYDNNDKNANPTAIHDDFFIRRDIGLIKMRLYHKFHNILYVWDLQRYHVVL